MTLLTSAKAGELARLVVSERESRGDRFTSCALETLTSAIAGAYITGLASGDDLVKLIVRTLESCRVSINPNWDGSIA